MYAHTSYTIIQSSKHFAATFTCKSIHISRSMAATFIAIDFVTVRKPIHTHAYS